MKTKNKSVKGIAAIMMIAAYYCCSCQQKKHYTQPTVEIETNFGDIVVELYPAKAPKTVAAFLSYVDSGYYKGGSFYRVLKAEDQPSSSFKSDLIQGGMWQTKNKLQTSLPGIPLETTKETGILHTDGIISLARSTPKSGNSEFFIFIGDQAGRAYDYGGDANSDGQGFAAFGMVIEGMDIVREIHKQPDDATSFSPSIAINNIVKL